MEKYPFLFVHHFRQSRISITVDNICLCTIEYMILRLINMYFNSVYTCILLIDTSKKTHTSDVISYLKTLDCSNVGERYQVIAPITHYPVG